MNLLERLVATCMAEEGLAPQYERALRAQAFADAVALLKEAIARDQDAHAMAVLAALYGLGQGVAQDALECATWFRQAANAGDAFGQTAFGVCLATGFGVVRDDAEAAYWLYRAARAGHRDAAEILRDLVMRDQSLVGPHFGWPAFLALMRALRGG
jgi:TPR repeat protein